MAKTKKTILEKMVSEKREEIATTKGAQKISASTQVENAILRDGETKEISRQTSIYKQIFNDAKVARIATKENAIEIRELSNVIEESVKRLCELLKVRACDVVTTLGENTKERDENGNAIKDAHTFRTRAIRHASAYKMLMDGTQKVICKDGIISRVNLFDVPNVRDMYAAIVDAIPSAKLIEEEAKRKEEEEARARKEEEARATRKRLVNAFPRLANVIDSMLANGMQEEAIQATCAMFPQI